MKQRGGGYVFNVSSLAGRNAFPGAAAYCASKHAVNGFSEALFQEVREDGIRVTYLMPGSVATEFGRGSTAKAGWALQPEDVGEMVVDLLRTNPRAMHSRVEMRPSRPKKGSRGWRSLAARFPLPPRPAAVRRAGSGRVVEGERAPV